MSYDTNRNLPNHTKLDYYECLAKIVLERMYPEEFCWIECNDKPDLQDHIMDIGVEVTRAFNVDQEKVDNLCFKMDEGNVRNIDGTKKTIISIYKKNKIYSRLQDCWEEYSTEKYGIHCGIPDTVSNGYDRILNVFYGKISKLNDGGYTVFYKNYLFVHSNILAINEKLEEILKQMIKKQSEYHKRFDKIIIYIPNNICTINLNKEIFEVKEIKSSLHFNFATAAGNMVVERENNPVL